MPPVLRPFVLFSLTRHLEIFPNPQVLLQTYSSKDPKLILAVPASLSHGPARHLFQDFAAVPDNVVLLTSRGEEGTLARALFDKWNDSQRPEDKWDRGKIGRNVMMDGAIKLRMNRKVPLSGMELEIYQQKEKAAREKEAAQQAAMARVEALARDGASVEEIANRLRSEGFTPGSGHLVTRSRLRRLLARQPQPGSLDSPRLAERHILGRP